MVDVGEGRFLALTLWHTAEEMDAARKAVGPAAQRLLDPLMSAPARLRKTGPVVINDLEIASARA